MVGTIIGGDITKVSFKKENGPFFVKEDLVVPEGATVTIEQGCVLLFKEFTTLNVYGSVMVKGTEDKPVVFTSANDSAYNHESSAQANPFDWNGIRLEKSSKGSFFECMYLNYSTFGLYSTNTELDIQKCQFVKNGQNSVMIDGKMQVVIEGMPYSYTKSTPSTPVQKPEQESKTPVTIELYGCMQYFINLFNPSPNSSLQSYVNTLPSSQLFITPSKPDLGVGAQLFYRMNKSISLTALIEYVPAHACSTYMNSLLDTTFWSFSQLSQYSLFTFGAGVSYDLMNSGRNVVSVAAIGKIGDVHYTMNINRSWLYMSGSDNYTDYIYKTDATLDGMTFGLNVGIRYQYRVTPRISLCADLSFDCLFSSAIDGNGNMTATKITSSNGVYQDTVLSNANHKFAIMKESLPGNAEYFDLIQDPDSPGNTAWSSLKEFTGFRLHLGVAYSF